MQWLTSRGRDEEAFAWRFAGEHRNYGRTFFYRERSGASPGMSVAYVNFAGRDKPIFLLLPRAIVIVESAGWMHILHTRGFLIWVLTAYARGSLLDDAVAPPAVGSRRWCNLYASDATTVAGIRKYFTAINFCIRWKRGFILFFRCRQHCTAQVSPHGLLLRRKSLSRRETAEAKACALELLRQ